MKGHILVDEIPFCSARDCGRRVSDLNSSVWLVRFGKFHAFCNDGCLEKTLESYLTEKAEAKRVKGEIEGRDLLKELQYSLGSGE